MKKGMGVKYLGRLVIAALSLAGALSSAALGADQESAFQVSVSDKSKVGSFEDISAGGADIVVLYTNDIHGAISDHEDFSGSSKSLGFAAVAGVKEKAQEFASVLLVDVGDADQGSVVTTESNGVDVQNLMRDIGYDLYTPGNHNFDYGMDEFLAYAEDIGRFLSCNFIDNRSGQSVLDAYRVVNCEADGKPFRIGFIGITTPETIAKSTPTFFQDSSGNYIYGFNAATDEDLYRSVQEAANSCRADGADMVIALSHLGDYGVIQEWSSLAVAEHTNGIDVFLDGHAESVLPGMFTQNMDGEDVLITSTGSELERIGALMINIDDDGNVTVTSNLVDKITDADKETDGYKVIEESVADIESKYEYLFDVEGKTKFKLAINDANGNRIVRNHETNLGDLITDAYRDFFGADIGIMNGGSIRADIDAGDIRYTDLLTVMPWNSEVTLVEMKGQTILDMLEMGAHAYPNESGGFIQCSGMEYTIDASIPSSVAINRENEFVSVDGEYRVKDVIIGGEPLDLDKTYTVSINRYYSQEYGDGMTMFRDSTMVKDSDESGEPYYDHDVFTAYLQNYEDSTVPDEYANPDGQGRLTIIEGGSNAAASVEEEAAETEVQTEEQMLLDPINPEYDFKTFCWGDTEEDVRAVEGDDIYASDKAAGYDAYYIAYDTTVVEVPVYLVYVFSDDGLMQVRYLFKQRHSDKTKYINDFKKIEKEITKKYGKPIRSGEKWDTDRHEEFYADDLGKALTYGYLTYDTSYDLPRTTIDLTMDADNYEISTYLIYQSKELTPEEQDFSDEF